MHVWDFAKFIKGLRRIVLAPINLKYVSMASYGTTFYNILSDYCAYTCLGDCCAYTCRVRVDSDWATSGTLPGNFVKGRPRRIVLVPINLKDAVKSTYVVDIPHAHTQVGIVDIALPLQEGNYRYYYRHEPNHEYPASYDVCLG